jgi:hypothetical protein
MLVQDREDLIALIRMRFGEPPSETIDVIYGIERLDTLQRLILVAANAPEWAVFMEELRSGGESFKIVGEQFNPI